MSDGLSFCNIRNPVGVVEVENTSVASNGTELVVIQSPCAFAGVWPRTFPFASVIFIGNDPSKYHPLASPVIASGLFTIEFGSGA